jgi:hypothetical protein
MPHSEIIFVRSQIHRKTNKYTFLGWMYRAVNTISLGYKEQSLNDVKWNNHCFSQIHTKHKNTLCGNWYRAVNTLIVSYKNQLFNAVQWNNRS